MKIVFGLSLDGCESLTAPQRLGEITCGPSGLLDVLELRLGLKRKEAFASRRLFQYKELLEELLKERDCFYRGSFTKDPYAVAETLLNWRDDLVLAGWDGQASEHDLLRLQDLAALEKRAGGRLTVGAGDRLRLVLRELDCRSPGIESFTVLDEQEHLPGLWRQVCGKLGAHYNPINPCLMQELASGSTDLGQIQSCLCQAGKTSPPKVRIGRDDSVVCLTALSEHTLARAVAQVLRHVGQEKKETVTLVGGVNAAFVEQALVAMDEPVLGTQPASRARPIEQVLLLALRLYWKPTDPRYLLEFLTHPVCPVSGLLRNRLAQAVAASPGVGGPDWIAAIESTKEGVRNKFKNDSAGLKASLLRIEDDLTDWLMVSQFEEDKPAKGTVLSECCSRVARWAIARKSEAEPDSLERDQFRALGAVAAELGEFLHRTPSVTRSQLERLLHQISGAGSPCGPAAEVGRAHRVPCSAAVVEKSDTVIWWDFSEPLPPPKWPWTRQELDQLKAHGATFLEPEVRASRENQIWLRPILAARRRLVLVMPRQRAGESVARHPLHARLLSLLEGKDTGLPVLDVDEGLSTGKAAAPLKLASLKPRSLPAPKRWWKLDCAKHLAPREEESYSSADKFIYSPYAWVLSYKAALQAGPIASLRLQDANRQRGNLLHRLVDLLLAEPTGKCHWSNVSQDTLAGWIEAQWMALLEKEGANLLLPGKRADAAALLETGKSALWELVRQLKQAGVVDAQSNFELPAAPFCGGRIGGILDLKVKNKAGRIAVVDLKSGGRKLREQELKENRALQLAIYGYLLSKQDSDVWPEAAYYILQSQAMLAHDQGFFADTHAIEAPNHPGGLPQCWKDFEQVWGWRRKHLDEGWIEVTVADTEPTLVADGVPGSIPPVGHWAPSEDQDKFNDFDALTGWRADA